MFDGNHRTSRRQQDFSGSTSRNRRLMRKKQLQQQQQQQQQSKNVGIGGVGASSLPSSSTATSPGAAASAVAVAGSQLTSRQAILEESRRLREERQALQRRVRASKRLQRAWRSYSCRKVLAGQLERCLLREEEEMSLARRTLVLNFRLSFRANDASKLRDMVADFAERIGKQSSSSSATGSSSFSWVQPEEATTPPRSLSSQQQPRPLCHRILRAIWGLVRKGTELDSCSTILRYCLRPPPPAVAATRNNNHHHYYNFWWKQLGGCAGYVNLLETLQYVLGYTNNTATTGDVGQVNQQQLVIITRDLWELVMAVTPGTLTGKSALAALVLSRRNLFRDLDSDDGIDNNNTTILNSLSRRILGGGEGGDYWNLFYHDWFYSFVRVTMMTSSSSDAADPMIMATQRIQSTANLTILSNALDLYYKLSNSPGVPPPDPAPALRLLQRVLEMSSDLAFLSSLMARGEDIHQATTTVSSTSAAAAAAAAGECDESDDSDDDDDGDKMVTTTHVRASDVALADSSSRGRGTVTRLSKQDLLTVPKIDRNYQTDLDRWRVDVLTNMKNNRHCNHSGTTERDDGTIQLAMQICIGEQWLKWGNALLSSPHDSEELWLTQEAYITLLATMLQSTTGLKARQSASSPLLTKLAFDKDFVEKLWRYVLVQLTNKGTTQSQLQNTYAAFSVFADVFTHRLIALKDDKFLVEHTTMNGPSVILAENVIVRLRDLLYELYWSKPVRASDVKVPFGRSLSQGEQFEAVRGRLLLTGTKLWQALYERWCRLLRHSPFCDESTWLFPHMTMLAGENVVGMRHPGEMMDDGDDMDLDSDDDSELDARRDEPMSNIDAETEGLADAFGDPKMARILTCIPQALPFDRRVKLFNALLTSDKVKTQDEAAEMQQSLIQMMRGEEADLSGRERVSIHRDRLYDDSMRQLNKLGPKLRRRVQVTFINQAGHEEAGIDGGGVFKEFIDDLITDAFSLESRSSTRRLFTVTPLQTLAVNPALTRDADLLLHYEFLGRVLGKAVYEAILVDPQFCLPFLNQLLGKTNSLEDLKNYDPEYYNNLTKLFNMAPDEIDSLHLTFELTLGDGASSRTVELVHGGRSKPVTKQNVIQYAFLLAHQKLNVESAAQTKAFLRGFRDLIPASWVRLFSAYELQKLISGDDSIRGIDINNLKAAMRYAAGYHPSQQIMVWFWEILEEMTAEEQRKFIKFMTSCSRQPLLGFSSLDPLPCIQQIRLPDDLLQRDPAKNAPLPTSSTCMNLLKLPNYKNKELMRIKLLAAIESGAGFELS